MKIGSKNRGGAKKVREPKEPPKAVRKVRSSMSKWKKQLLITGVMGVLTVAIFGISSFGRNTFAEMEKESVEHKNSIANDITTFQASDPYFVRQTDETQESNPEIVYKGGIQLDQARWQADADKFWEFISPAFNYNDADEYNKMRDNYRSDSVLGTCRFTVNFLTYYDIRSAAVSLFKSEHPRDSLDENGDPPSNYMEKAKEAYKCFSPKDYYQTFPIGKTDRGDYRYLAFLYWGRSSGSKLMPIAFTFTAFHDTNSSDNSVRIVFNDFEYWAPDSAWTYGLTYRGNNTTKSN